MTAPRDPAAGATPAREEVADVVERGLGFVADFHGDARCSLNCKYSEALAGEVHRLRAALRERDAAREDAAVVKAWRIHRAMCDRLFSVRRRYFAALQEQTRKFTTDGSLVAWPDVLVVLRDEWPEAVNLAARDAGGPIDV